jgi:TetR/AcrR family transcriptional regulator
MNLPMPDASPLHDATAANAAEAVARKRPKPGERRVQILQALAAMLEQPAGERITTASLAARLGVSEAALYRHFASKAQMFEGLIDFIENSIFALVQQITDRLPDATMGATDVGVFRATKIATVLVQFAEKNPGMARVMVGDALVLEHDRLQQRMNLLFDKVEAALRQCLRDSPAVQASAAPTVDAQVRAAAVTAFVAGRLQRYARSGFRRMPSEQLEPALRLMLG